MSDRLQKMDSLFDEVRTRAPVTEAELLDLVRKGAELAASPVLTDDGARAVALRTYHLAKSAIPALEDDEILVDAGLLDAVRKDAARIAVVHGTMSSAMDRIRARIAKVAPAPPVQLSSQADPSPTFLRWQHDLNDDGQDDWDPPGTVH